MGDILTLDDGRQLARSSFGISGLLHFVAKYLPDGNDQLRRWLFDVSKRCNGMMSVDLRGLTDEHREAFHLGARAAYDDTVGMGREITPTSYALMTLAELIAMQDSMRRGERPEDLTDIPVADHEPFSEDINEIWDAGP